MADSRATPDARARHTAADGNRAMSNDRETKYGQHPTHRMCTLPPWYRRHVSVPMSASRQAITHRRDREHGTRRCPALAVPIVERRVEPQMYRACKEDALVEEIKAHVLLLLLGLGLRLLGRRRGSTTTAAGSWGGSAAAAATAA